MGNCGAKKKKINPVIEQLGKPPAHMLVTTSKDATIGLYNIDTQTMYRNMGKCHDKTIKCMVVADKGRLLFTAGSDNKLKVWDRLGV